MRAYSEKEIAIFEGVRRLMTQQVNMAQVTASDIAQAAGIGKGTLYNYFATKDDIIAETVMYVIELQLGEVSRTIEVESSFAAKLQAAFAMIGKLSQQRDSQIQLALAGMDQQLPMLEKGMPRMREIFIRIRSLLCKLIALGEEEGVIAPISEAYAMQVVRSVMMGFCQPEFWGEELEPVEIRANWAYQMMIKALN